MSTLRAKAPLHKNRNTTLQRIGGFISKTSIFNDINLWSHLYGETAPFVGLEVWSLPGGSGAWKGYTFAEIIQQVFVPAAIGDSFGPTWTTHWFRVTVDVPAGWQGREVHLRWATRSEATLWSPEGVILQGLSPIAKGEREEYIISKNWDGGGGGADPLTFYIEMACNEMGGNDGFDGIRPPNPDLFFTLTRAEVAVFNRTLSKLYTDLEVLHGIADQMPNEHIGYQALFAANEMVTLIKVALDMDSDDPEGGARAREEQLEAASRIADDFFAEGNGAKAHTLVSMGHCHIDTAWLWPYDETIRKVVRSWTTQLALMEEYPEFVFAASSAQQYAWMKEWYPELYGRLKEAVTGAGGGRARFVPVGGAWLEMDGNIPSGEGFLRQFFYGQRFFLQEFGLASKEFWLPDTFGYSAQIPQIMRHVGIERFITQKISWNLVNKFPNHSFWWEGIDGSKVLVHFPPGDSYNMSGTVQQMLFSRNNSEDKGRANVGLYLFGHGDGGGGPTREMIERQIRCKNVDGVPKVQFGTPEDFWTELEREGSKLYKWVGELYLELHNGTYTSQAKIKWYNRKGEIFFREVELLLAIAIATEKVTQAKLEADMELLDTNWKLLLLNQFHDVLPGTSIEMVTQDSWKIYEDIFRALTTLRSEYHTLLLAGTGPPSQFVYNALNWDYQTVIFQLPDAGRPPPSGPNVQTVTLREEPPFEEATEGRYRVPNTFSASLVSLAASGYSPFTPVAPSNPVTYSEPDPGVKGQFSNGLVRLEFSLTTETGDGQPEEKLYFTGPSGIERAVYKNRVNAGTPTSPGHLYIYDDVPLFWDAWDVMDYHLETRRPMPIKGPLPEPPSTFATGPIVGGYKWSATFGRHGSTVERYTFIRANSPMVETLLVVDWKESHKFMKVEWPVDVLSREATFEIQYGHAVRPTHINTSWDMAKFEVCGHKWVDISQGDKGVTFVSDAKYGWHVRDNVVSLSLLRSPKNPDPNCDMHVHYIHYAVLPHEGRFQEAGVIQRAYELNYYGANNVPLLGGSPTTGEGAPLGFVSVSHPAVIVEAVKPAHDVPGSVVVRLYESHGGAAEGVVISLGFTVAAVNECDGLERVGAPIQHSGNTFTSDWTPFQLRTFIIAFQ